MERLSHRLYCWLSRIRARIRRRFTTAGLVVLVGIPLTGLLGIDTEQALAYQAFAVLCALTLVAGLCAPFFRAQIRVRRLTPRLVSVGERVSYTVAIRNDTGKVQRGLVLQERPANAEPTFEEYRAWLRASRRWPSFQLVTKPPAHLRGLFRETPIPPLPAGKETEVQVELLPLRRGPLTLTACTFARADPLGLVRAELRVKCPGTILVLPKRYPLPPLALPGTIKYQQGGVTLASSVGESQEYVFLREYRRGDPVRHVHWRSWARLGKPIVKEFQDEFFVRHALILDTFTDKDDEELFEEAVSVAASFAYTIQTQESLLDLMFVGPQAFCFTAGRGLARTEQLLEILASVTPCRDQTFDTLETLVMTHAGGLSGCVCVLQAWDEPRRRLVHKLRALSVPVQVLVLRRGNEPLADLAGVDPGEFAVLELGRVGKDLAALRRSGVCEGFSP